MMKKPNLIRKTKKLQAVSAVFLFGVEAPHCRKKWTILFGQLELDEWSQNDSNGKKQFMRCHKT